MITNLNSIGKAFKMTRLAKGYKMSYMAEKIGINISTYSRFESGKLLYVSNDILTKGSGALDCDLIEILILGMLLTPEQNRPSFTRFIDSLRLLPDKDKDQIKTSYETIFLPNRSYPNQYG